MPAGGLVVRVSGDALNLELGSAGHLWSSYTHGKRWMLALSFTPRRSFPSCPVCDHRGAAGNCPWLDLMGRGKEVEEGLDLSVG
jgi:hypothetical protein